MDYNNWDSPMAQSRSLHDCDYTELTWNVTCGLDSAGQNEAVMLKFELIIAIRIYSWLNEHPEFKHYRDYIKMVPYQTYRDPDASETLRWNLWQRMDAASWIGSRNAPSHNALLWQFAVVRLSKFLNTGDW